MKNIKTQNTLLTIILLTFSISLLFAFDQTQRDLPTFNSIALGTSAKVYLKQGHQQSIVLEGDEQAKQQTLMTVKNGKLSIRHKNSGSGYTPSYKNISIYITIQELKSLEIGGSGEIITEGRFNADDLDLSISGSGNLELDTDAKDMDVSISGSGDVKLKGRSESNSVYISGSGSLNAEGMETEDYQINISGSGKCRIHVNSELNSRISGSGSIHYMGEPDKINSKSSGSGTIKKIRETK